MSEEVHLPSLTYDELIQLVIINLRKCPKLEIQIENDPLLMEAYDVWINGEMITGCCQFREVLEALAAYEYEEPDET